jgi:hypothetical protein
MTLQTLVDRYILNTSALPTIPDRPPPAVGALGGAVDGGASAVRKQRLAYMRQALATWKLWPGSMGSSKGYLGAAGGGSSSSGGGGGGGSSVPPTPAPDPIDSLTKIAESLTFDGLWQKNLVVAF